jgi:hypothetical protein
MGEIYIEPITRIHATFAEAKEFLENGGYSVFEEAKTVSLANLAQGTRNLIVGEPGVGKSLLLRKIDVHLKAEGFKTALIGLRQSSAMREIDKFLAVPGNKKALLLDALDEVKGSQFPEVLEKIKDIADANPKLAFFISGRWVFIDRYAHTFPSYRLITISPFRQDQVKDYLRQSGHQTQEIDRLLDRIMPLGQRQLVIQIPRYLQYLNLYLEKKGIDAASKVSRNDLFEFFIYQKLTLEETKLNTQKREMIQRFLEQLALAMEIYQANEIKKDELMTFLDEFQSDLKQAAVAQIDIEIFYEYSLLKNNPDTVEFENTEFQEYLAAKEIKRQRDPARAAFAVAVEPNTKEIYPSWYNALIFLVDMLPALLEQVVEFSGLRSGKKILDEAFFLFLSRIDPRTMTPELRPRLFRDVLDYHDRALQWLPGELPRALPGLFDPSLEPYLKERVAAAEAESGTRRFVPLGNLTYVVAYLLEDNAKLDRPYWRAKLIEYASDRNSNGVLQRHALLALQFLADPSVIDELPDLTSGDSLIMQHFISLHTSVDPDHPKSLQHATTVTKRNQIYGRYTLFAIRDRQAIKRFLQALIDDEMFLREFLDDTSIFRERDRVMVGNVESVLDDEIRELAENLLVRSANHRFTHRAEESEFLKGLWKLLRKDDPGLIAEIVTRVRKAKETDLYFINGFLAEVIQMEDVAPFIAALNDNDRWLARDVMARIRYSKRPEAAEIYEAGRELIPDVYKALEDTTAQRRQKSEEKRRARKLLKEFRFHLEPEAGRYMSNVFEFFNTHIHELEPLLTPEDRQRMSDLLSGTIFKFMDPGKSDLTIQSEEGGRKSYTMDSTVALFGDALRAAQHLGFDTAPYRQQIVNLIPFSYNDQLDTIFTVLKGVTAAELAPVIEIYRTRQSDLWRHQPESFLRAVEEFHVSAAAPVLRELILEPFWQMHVRRQALRVVESVDPDPGFLRTLFAKYGDSAEASERELAEAANGLLITNHDDSDAVRWRLQEVIKRAVPFVRPRGGGVRSVGPIEEEIAGGKSFAAPLMELKYPGYEEDYLQLLDDAMAVFERGTEFEEYAIYLWSIVHAYFNNLKETRSYGPLKQFEAKVRGLKDRNGGNWLAARTADLRRSYLAYLGRPASISKAVETYNAVRAYDDSKIQNSTDLYRQLTEVFNGDLRRWIEGEGGYDVLGKEISAEGIQEYEKLVQKTVTTQIENALLRRGFEIRILREAQLLDHKRTDLLIYYGFVGPVVVEIKLTSNSDLKGSKVEASESYASMERYMLGYNAAHGIFMIFDNAEAANLRTIAAAFEKIPGVAVVTFAVPRKAPRNAAKGKKPAKPQNAAKRKKPPKQGKPAKRTRAAKDRKTVERANAAKRKKPAKQKAPAKLEKAAKLEKQAKRKKSAKRKRPAVASRSQ